MNAQVLRCMADAGERRGQDGIGYWVAGNVGLANAALHTTSEAARERQPVAYADRGVCLSADVRLDNRPELIAELATEARLRDDEPTDSELILAAYECWGEECANHLVGDFAFALWDGREQRLFCARGPLGIKPLHFACVGQTVCIASEAQQCLRHPGVTDHLDPVGLADHLVNNTFDEERTVYADVRRLPAGHYLVADVGRTRLRRYWPPDRLSPLTYTRDEEYDEHFLHLFRRAVADRIRTDADCIGLFMSGGLDSCSVAGTANALLASDGRRRLLAWSYGFEKIASCDEGTYSRAMAEHAGIELNFVDAERRWLLGDASAFRPDRETPFLGWEATDREILRSAKARGVRVVLTGHTISYSQVSHALMYAHRLVRGQMSVFGELRRLGRKRGQPMPRMVWRYVAKPLLPHAVNRGVGRLAGRSALVPHWVDRAFARRTQLEERCAHQDWLRVSPLRPVWGERRPFVPTGPVGRAIGSLDRGAAAHGIEARHPYLDQRLVEFFCRVPPERMHPEGVRRVIIRRAMQGVMPDAVRWRPDKSNLAAFVHDSLRHRAASCISALFEDPAMGALGMVDAAALRETYDQYRRDGTAPGAARGLWWPITLEMWLRARRNGWE